MRNKTQGHFTIAALIRFVLFIIVSFDLSFSADLDKDTISVNSTIEGFKKGSLFINAGILYGCGAFGGEVEFGIFNKIGLQLGAGLVGLNAGPILHIYSNGRHDITMGLLIDYLPGIRSIAPEMNIGYRLFPGQRGRVGIAMRCGSALSTTDTMIKDGKRTIIFEKGRPFLTYAIGVTVKAIKGKQKSEKK